MTVVSEKEVIEDIKKEIKSPLAALVSRLRRSSPRNTVTSYIDQLD